MDENEVLRLRERLSALADGELAGEDVAALMDAAGQAGRVQAVLATWQTYHLIGDVLRGGEQAAAHASAGFLGRLQARLAQEGPLALERPVLAEPLQAVVRRAEPANDASFRWKMVAGCASFAAVAALAWGIVGGSGPVATSSQMALVAPPAQTQPEVAVVAESPVPVESIVTLPSGEAQVMIRDARLDELLAAHKQAGGSSALQMPAPAGFLRSATFSASDR
ncbi:sigma-E factor negative regulatory protein [Pseudorhodoferax sp.]|uniref:sigma-E factor negative regulatory protein n=1 Tax=Pseudorhodoferax sp. TaxID=1993553 RepID=UPI0039E5242F